VPAKTSLAVIFDFDDTLTDDSTAALLAANGIDPQDFYKNKVNQLVVAEAWDPCLAYLHLVIDQMNGGKIKQVTNEALKKFGAGLKPYQGLQAVS
jgi:hypothetical protein